MTTDKSNVIASVATALLQNNKSTAKALLSDSYPHQPFIAEKRNYTLAQKMAQFLKDGFIDRYTGQKLLNPGILKIISVYLPDDFPFHPHWKMTDTHIAYWELTPTIDHIYPIANGGVDDESNWVTTSMKNNSIKSNYTIDEIHWSICPAGNLQEWDGLTSLFILLAENDSNLLNDPYIKKWYRISKQMLAQQKNAAQSN